MDGDRGESCRMFLAGAGFVPLHGYSVAPSCRRGARIQITTTSQRPRRNFNAKLA
jgi:hypothetical protein